MISEASDRYLNIYSNTTDSDTLFDLKTGAQRSMDSEGIMAVGDWRWKLIIGREVQMQLRRANGPAKLYDCPSFEADGMKPNFPDWMRVSPESNRFETLLVNRYYCWELSSGKLKCDVPLVFSGGAIAPLTRDGKTLAIADDNAIAFVSTVSGKVARRVPFITSQSYQATQFSGLGTYALCEANNAVPATNPNLVIETRTGRVLWKFNREGWWDVIFFSPNEKLLVLPQITRRVWELRDTKTGRVLRTLPLVPGAHGGAFSPDGATLYSVANGVLYRQRAR